MGTDGLLPINEDGKDFFEQYYKYLTAEYRDESRREEVNSLLGHKELYPAYRKYSASSIVYLFQYLLQEPIFKWAHKHGGISGFTASFLFIPMFLIMVIRYTWFLTKTKYAERIDGP